MAEIKAAVNLQTRQVHSELQYAADRGWLEQVRLKLQATADKAPLVLDTILDANVEELSKHHRGYALKSEVARDVMKGMGVFSPEQKRTTVNLHNWHAQHDETPAPAAPTDPLPIIDLDPYEHDTPTLDDDRTEPATPDDGDPGGRDPDEPGESW